ncbi:MAG: leucine-rich repeat domain-containing protein [Kiritimatiellia bacterium]
MRKLKLEMLLVALLTSVLAFGETFTDGNGLVWTYTASSGNATLSDVAKADGSALDGALTIPSTVKDDVKGVSATVTAIKKDTFKGLPITGLTVADSVTTIGAGAFSGCSSLKSVVFGSGLVTIGDGNSNSSTSNPDSLAYSGAFGNCINLETVTFGSALLKIGHHAFSECRALTELTFPDSLQTIGRNAFCRNTSLASVSFGTNLETIDTCGFYDCAELQSVVFRSCDTPRLTIGKNAFAKAVKLTTLTFSESLQTIYAGAFAGCTSLTALTFPDSLTAIYADGSGGAFNGCSSLKNVVFGSGLVTIGDGNSNHNTSNPDSLADSGAFGNCINLETVTFGNALREIGHHAFSECRELKVLEFPDSLQRIGINAFYNNIRLTRASFGANLQTVDTCAFMGCVSLNSVSFSPATTPLLMIKSNAFRNCLCLASLTLPNSIPTIASGAFSGCTMLRRITIPSLLSTIESGVFTGMGNLKEVIFLGLPPENLGNAGLAKDVSIRYPSEYAQDWEDVIASCGFTNASVYEPDEIGGIVGDSRYGLSAKPSDRSIASLEISADTAIDSFILTDGKVYDSVLRIVNTADGDVTLTLPAGYTYETFEGADPLTIPAKSRNILTITRTAENVFLVTREKLRVLQAAE